jgi:hypothetical protein
MAGAGDILSDGEVGAPFLFVFVFTRRSLGERPVRTPGGGAVPLWLLGLFSTGSDGE